METVECGVCGEAVMKIDIYKKNELDIDNFDNRFRINHITF